MAAKSRRLSARSALKSKSPSFTDESQSPLPASSANDKESAVKDGNPFLSELPNGESRQVGIAPNDVRAYVERSGFVKGPAYMQEINSVLEKESAYIQALPTTDGEALSGSVTVRLLTEMEREILLEGLTSKRDQVSQSFEADLSLHFEDNWRWQVQQRYLPEMRQLDKDITRMKQQYIFVACDP
mmetsp:Transcript_98068/g.194147  ORF Transcript_98068/g.194147 Transcript_98068/m.194147 type:complete len:185 (-) Transcript_98068:18-572(-)